MTAHHQGLAKFGYRSARPTGVRSCRDGGGIPVRPGALGPEALWVHLEAALCDVDETLRAFMKEEVKRKLRAARKGALTYGRRADVEAISSTADRVLELRLPVEDMETTNLKAQLRLYFAEPDHEPAVIALLSLDRKPMDDTANEVQNQHAQDALKLLWEYVQAGQSDTTL